MQAIEENRRILENMKAMERTRNTLTPMIGLSLAALVAGSLVSLAVLAQRVSLNVPYPDQVAPMAPQGGAEGPPLVVENPPPDSARELDRDRDLDVPPDRVLPLRIARPATPAANPPADREQPDNPDKPRPEERTVHSLPPGIIKKLGRGGPLPPGHSKRAAAGAKPHPPLPATNGHGRGACGVPPCGNASGHDAGNSDSSRTPHFSGGRGKSGKQRDKR